VTRLISGLLGHNMRDTLATYLQSVVVMAFLFAISAQFITFERALKLIPIIAVAVVAAQYFVAVRLSSWSKLVDNSWNRASATASFWIAQRGCRDATEWQGLMDGDVKRCYEIHIRYYQLLHDSLERSSVTVSRDEVIRLAQASPGKHFEWYYKRLVDLDRVPYRNYHVALQWKRTAQKDEPPVSVWSRVVRKALSINIAAEGMLVIVLLVTLVSTATSLLSILPDESWLGFALPIAAVLSVLLLDEALSAVNRLLHILRARDHAGIIASDPQSLSAIW
jgi:hypothetical protein